MLRNAHTLRPGADLSRSKIMYYDHNDMECLEAVLKKVGCVQV